MARKYAKKHRTLLNKARPYYEDMLAAQGSKCPICKRPPYDTRRFDIDHDHATMLIRGLLCVRCNQWLWGFVTIEILEAAIEYLKSQEGRSPEWYKEL